MDLRLDTGDCGQGPNMFLRPLDIKLHNMGTPARVTDLLKEVCSVDVSPSLLKATEVCMICEYQYT